MDRARCARSRVEPGSFQQKTEARGNFAQRGSGFTVSCFEARNSGLNTFEA